MPDHIVRSRPRTRLGRRVTTTQGKPPACLLLISPRAPSPVDPRLPSSTSPVASGTVVHHEMPDTTELPTLVVPPEPPIPPPTGNWAHVRFNWNLHHDLTDMELLTQARIYIKEDESRWPAGMANSLRNGWMDNRAHAYNKITEEGHPILTWRVEGEFIDIRHQYLQAETILVQWQRDLAEGRGLPFDRSRLFRYPRSRWNYVIVF